MTTMERTVEHTDIDTRPDRRPLIVVLVAVGALAIGALSGWMLRGSDDSVNDAIEVASGELTERQTEMVRIADEHFAAHKAVDGEALTNLYVPQGVLEFYGMSGFETLRADDGTMAAWFENQAASSRMEMMAPVLVFDDSVSRVIDFGPGYGTTIHKFTTSGEVLIISSQVTFGN